MNRQITAILVFCLIVFACSFYFGVTKEASVLSVSLASFLCFVALYAAGFLGYKVGGSHLSLEAKVHNLELEREEQRKAVSALIKVLYVVYDGAGRIGGGLSSHDQLIEKYLAPIEDFVDKDSIQEAIREIRDAHK